MSEGEVKRDRFGRPLVTPPSGGKPVAYTRATTISDTLSDTFGLTGWKLRQAAVGLAGRRDLLAATVAANGDSRALDAVVASAMEASGSSAAATMGTALHSLTEQIDLGYKPVAADDSIRGDLEAYTAEMQRQGATVEAVECFGVLDELQVAGTADRILRLPDGRRVIADLKCGRADYLGPKVAIQLALYSRMLNYDLDTEERAPREVDQDTAVVIHLPAGQGVCTWYDVPIAEGWEAVDLAMKVRAWRKRKDLLRPRVEPDEVARAISMAANEGAVRTVWKKYSDRWDESYTEMAKAKIAALKGGL